MAHWGIGQWASAVGIGLAVITLIGFGLDRIGKPMRRVVKKFEEFEVDWYGKEARKGFDAIPGIPERLQGIEKSQADGVDRLGNIETQLKTNGGGTLRDEIVKIRDRLDEHQRLHTMWASQPPQNPPSEGNH